VSPSTRRLVFIDGETTGLDRENAELWELAVIERTTHDDVEYCWQIRPHMLTADPQALQMNHFYERCNAALLGRKHGAAIRTVHPDRIDVQTDAFAVAFEVARIISGAVIVGSKPWFDERFLQRWLRDNHQCAANHYALVDAGTYAAGYLGLDPPWRLDDAAGDLGVKINRAERHTALGDARLARDVWDAVNPRPRPYLVEADRVNRDVLAILHPGGEAS
jgi:oligoribonuclease (3'-5' exoribonuclease)